MSAKLSVVIIAKNEERDIEGAFRTSLWADEIILLDGRSTDKTLEIARSYPVRIVTQQTIGKIDYAVWHNQGLKETKSEWLFYLDADERFTPELAGEIKAVIRSTDKAAFRVPRRNIMLGRELRHGGWFPDYQPRLFKKSALLKWTGALHESPHYRGGTGYLREPFIHLQPEKLEPMFAKSIRWSEIESGNLFKANHPPVVWWRVIRMWLTTLLDRLIKKQGCRDGVEGWIESFYQAYHAGIVYLRLWEVQGNMTNKSNTTNKPNMPNKSYVQ